MDGDGSTGEQIFAAIWESISDILGTAATAALLKRSLKRAATSARVLGEIAIERKALDYHYTLPAHWRTDRRESADALRSLAVVLTSLLAELTGDIVLRRLAANPVLRRAGLFSSSEERP